MLESSVFRNSKMKVEEELTEACKIHKGREYDENQTRSTDNVEAIYLRQVCQFHVTITNVNNNRRGRHHS